MTLIFNYDGGRKNRQDRLREFQTNLLKSHLSYIILFKLENNKALTGYDIIKYNLAKFKIRLSSKTVYRLLYSLEHYGLILGRIDASGRRIYTLTPEGDEYIKTVRSFKNEIRLFVANIFEG